MQKKSLIILSVLILFAIILSGCVGKIKEPICGNGICEMGESTKEIKYYCPSDCGEKEIINEDANKALKIIEDSNKVKEYLKGKNCNITKPYTQNLLSGFRTIKENEKYEIIDYTKGSICTIAESIGAKDAPCYENLEEMKQKFCENDCDKTIKEKYENEIKTKYGRIPNDFWMFILIFKISTDYEKCTAIPLLDNTNNEVMMPTGKFKITEEDNKAPEQISIQIEEGINYTNKQKPNIKLKAIDKSTPIKMRFSLDENNFTQWINYTENYNDLNLLDKSIGGNSNQGTKKVFVQFKDSKDNNSLIISDEIIFDDVAPVLSKGKPTEKINTTKTMLEIKTNEQAKCKYGTKNNSFNELTNESNLSTQHSWELTNLTTGKKEYYIKCIDLAGNISSTTKIEFQVILGGGGGETTPKTTTLTEKEITIKLTKEEIKNLLEKARITGEQNLLKAIELNKKIIIKKTLKVSKTEETGKKEVIESKITTTIKNETNETLKKLQIIEKIPKTIIEKTSEIKKINAFKIIEEDPIIEFTIDSIEKGEEITIEYDLNKELKEENLNEIKTIAFTQEIEKKECLEECCIETKETKAKECPEEKECIKGKCITKKIEKKEEKPITIPLIPIDLGELTIPIIIGIIGIIIIVIIIIVIKKKKRIKETKKEETKTISKEEIKPGEKKEIEEVIEKLKEKKEKKTEEEKPTKEKAKEEENIIEKLKEEIENK